MKSIFDQYRALNEGELSKSQFLRNVKMALPKFISNMTSFDDAVKILKNKGIITEAKLHESMGEKLAEETGDEINNLVASGKLTQEQGNQIDDYLNDNTYEVFESGDFYDADSVIEYALKQLQINVSLNESKNYTHQYDPQQYDLGMRYELDKGTDEEKASKIVCKNLEKRASYYTDLYLAGYNEDAMKLYDKRDGSDLDTEVKKDNFVDKKNQVKKVKLDKLTEDELKVLVGNILAEVADQKKTSLTESPESIENQIQQRTQKRIDYRQEHYGTVEDSEKKLYRILSINDLKRNPNLSDEDRAYLDAEFDKLKDKSSGPSQPSSPEMYRLGQRGNYTGD